MYCEAKMVHSKSVSVCDRQSTMLNNNGMLCRKRTRKENLLYVISKGTKAFYHHRHLYSVEGL